MRNDDWTKRCLILFRRPPLSLSSPLFFLLASPTPALPAPLTGCDLRPFVTLRPKPASLARAETETRTARDIFCDTARHICQPAAEAAGHTWAAREHGPWRTTRSRHCSRQVDVHVDSREFWTYFLLPASRAFYHSQPWAVVSLSPSSIYPYGETATSRHLTTEPGPAPGVKADAVETTFGFAQPCLPSTSSLDRP